MRATEVTGAHNCVTARVVDATVHIVYATVRNEERIKLRDLEYKAADYRNSQHYMLGIFVIPIRDLIMQLLPDISGSFGCFWRGIGEHIEGASTMFDVSINY